MNIKVAIIDPLGSHGSSHHFYLFGQAMGLKDSHAEVRIYTNKETPDPKISAVKFYTFYGNLFAYKNKMRSTFTYFIGSIRSILHARFSGVRIFHYHIFRMRINMLFNMMLTKLVFGKVVLTIHDVNAFAEGKDANFYAKWIYRLADLILTHNHFSKEEILKLNPNYLEKIKIIPHGNYVPFISVQTDKITSRNRLGFPEDKTILLFFGMIKKVKGLEVLLHAFKEVLQKHNDVVLVIAGKPWENDFESYQQIIDENQLSAHIIMHTKFIPQQDVEHYYCAADLVVLPYKRIYQSGVLMMTLSYQKPALVSDLPPLKEVITDNENGFLFQSENAKDLAEKISFILSDKANLSRVQKNGTQLIHHQYNWEEIGKQTLQAYAIL